VAQQKHLSTYVFAPKAKISRFKRSLSSEKLPVLRTKKTAHKEQVRRQQAITKSYSPYKKS
jgi:hypothetical protein